MLGAVHIRLPFVVAGALTLLNWIYGLIVLPESLPKENRSPFLWRRANPVGAFFVLKKYPLVMGMAISLFLMHMAQFALHATWALAMQFRFAWTPVHIGMSLAMVGVCAAIVQGGLVRRLVPALGERRSLLIGLGIGVMAYVGYGAATQGWMIFAVIAVGSLAAIAQPAGQALITREVAASEQGAVQGALASLMSLAGIVGPIIGGATLAHFIQTPPPLPDAPFNLVGANFYLSALIAVFGWIAAAWAVRHLGERRAPAHDPVAAGGADSQPS
jgi:DHA1 family tetracycline resistance protein-like MFS transporter